MLGRAWVFLLAVVVIIGWVVSGPFFDYSESWQLIINTGTTIVTFLMVFLIQNTQNRDARAMHVKLDELLRAVEGARGALADAEDRTEEDLKRLKEQLTGVCVDLDCPPEVHATHAARDATQRLLRHSIGERGGRHG